MKRDTHQMDYTFQNTFRLQSWALGIVRFGHSIQNTFRKQPVKTGIHAKGTGNGSPIDRRRKS